MYHERGRYPTEKGVAVSPYEIWLPRTETLETNVHHGEFEARLFGKSIILLTLRNLECLQWDMPIDQHNWLHYNYGMPVLPTINQAMDKIEEQLYTGGLLQIKHKGKGYIQRVLTDEDFNRCITAYDQEKRGNR